MPPASPKPNWVTRPPKVIPDSLVENQRSKRSPVTVLPPISTAVVPAVERGPAGQGGGRELAAGEKCRVGSSVERQAGHGALLVVPRVREVQAHPGEAAEPECNFQR